MEREPAVLVVTEDELRAVLREALSKYRLVPRWQWFALLTYANVLTGWTIGGWLR